MLITAVRVTFIKGFSQTCRTNPYKRPLSTIEKSHSPTYPVLHTHTNTLNHAKLNPHTATVKSLGADDLKISLVLTSDKRPLNTWSDLSMGKNIITSSCLIPIMMTVNFSLTLESFVLIHKSMFVVHYATQICGNSLKVCTEVWGFMQTGP